MKNTAIQDLIEKWQNQYILWVNNGSVNETEGEIMQSIIKSLESKLEKEKQDLIDTCQTGINKALDYSFEPQDYYNKTFKQ